MFFLMDGNYFPPATSLPEEKESQEEEEAKARLLAPRPSQHFQSSGGRRRLSSQPERTYPTPVSFTPPTRGLQSPQSDNLSPSQRHSIGEDQCQAVMNAKPCGCVQFRNLVQLHVRYSRNIEGETILQFVNHL